MSGELKSGLGDFPRRVRVGKTKVSLSLPVKKTTLGLLSWQ